jgi:hypothetical protein
MLKRQNRRAPRNFPSRLQADDSILFLFGFKLEESLTMNGLSFPRIENGLSSYTTDASLHYDVINRYLARMLSFYALHFSSTIRVIANRFYRDAKILENYTFAHTEGVS